MSEYQGYSLPPDVCSAIPGICPLSSWSKTAGRDPAIASAFQAAAWNGEAGNSLLPFNKRYQKSHTMFPFTSDWPRCSHMTIFSCKGVWKFPPPLPPRQQYAQLKIEFQLTKQEGEKGWWSGQLVRSAIEAAETLGFWILLYFTQSSLFLSA